VERRIGWTGLVDHKPGDLIEAPLASLHEMKEKAVVNFLDRVRGTASAQGGEKLGHSLTITSERQPRHCAESDYIEVRRRLS
jgi:hypothetical protein